MSFSAIARPSPHRRPPGFALVVTLSLFVLLTVLVVGLLGLSSISLRSGNHGQYAAQARANARMALVLAIGELQRRAGPDTRVTARADILDDDNPPLLGVWKSWEGANHDAQGRPVSPGNYRSAKENRFLAWLVSGDDPRVLPDTAERKGAVALVGRQSVGSGAAHAKMQVHLSPVPIGAAAGNGAFAWWIGGENQKARLPEPFKPEDDSPARWAVVAKSHTVADPEPFGLETLLVDASAAAKTVTLPLGDFIARGGGRKVSREFFHDLSTTSTGLLTNTATGGWRKDISLLTENWNTLPSSLPFFRLNPERDIVFTRPTSGNPTPARSMLYPWSAYRGGGSDYPIYRHGPVSSWENLKDYATAYKRISASASGRNRIGTHSVAIDDAGNAFNFLHKIRLLPVIARVQWVFSHSAGAAAQGRVEPRLLLTPVITLWNPYNVEISIPGNLSFNISKPLPAALQYTINGIQNSNYNALTAGSLNNYPALSAATSLSYQISASNISLGPGETRVFSPPANTVLPATSSLTLQQGYRGSGGHYFQLRDSQGNPMTTSPAATISADARFDTAYFDHAEGVGIYLDMLVNGRLHLVYRMVYTREIANEVYKPLTQLAETTLAAAQAAPVPVLSTVLGARMASKTHIPAKGFLQSSPLVNYTAMGDKDRVESTIARKYGGTNHPVNSPFDYSFIKHAPGGDSQLPNASDTSGRGYIVTGFNKSDGLSRCVIAEVPTRPLLSLGELQHWDLRYENPIPPYAFNLIGNSDATPLLPPDAVVNSSDANLAVNLQHDDSYCANHLLFDDWFFSSIAPDPNHFGSSGKTIQQVHADFVTGASPLGNRAYRPIAEDTGFASAGSGNAAQLYDEHIRRSDSWRTVASRLEVEGMFNVNSTSVTAWRALLGHARNQRVPHIRESGGGWSVDLSRAADHPVSRFSIAGDTEAGDSGSSGAFPEAAEFAGYRVLDDGFIDKLAEEIVAQVRTRGPFLSLAEFVNRQLSSGDLALAGTVQAALNELARSSSTNLYKNIQSTVGDAGRSLAVPVRAADAAYKFPAAAEGWNAFGLPGWTRQADILRPLAPILSARDDTFTIRAHGDARDEKGNVVSRAVCEAVVRRNRHYVDSRDSAELATPPTSAINKIFGRRFEVISFRWLNPSEI